MRHDSTSNVSAVERAPWALFVLAIALFALLAWTTVDGALASNRDAGAFQRALRQREEAVFTRASLDPTVVQRGRATFLGTCIACHGPNGEALPNLGKDLAHSEFVAGQSDKQLQTFLKLGRPTWDPANTTKVDMPGKGGNPKLTDADLSDLVQYLRFLQAAATP